MPAGYWITMYKSIKSAEKLAAYAAIGGPVIIAQGGKFIARGMPTEVFEAGQMERTVVIRFESVEAAIKTYKSAEYKLALDALGDGAEREIRIVEGTE